MSGVPGANVQQVAMGGSQPGADGSLKHKLKKGLLVQISMNQRLATLEGRAGISVFLARNPGFIVFLAPKARKSRHFLHRDKSA